MYGNEEALASYDHTGKKSRYLPPILRVQGKFLSGHTQELSVPTEPERGPPTGRQLKDRSGDERP